MQFRAVVIPSGNATAVELPDVVMQSLGPEARPPVTISINGHSWRSRVAVMNRQRLVGISAANRAAAGIEAGQTIDLDVSLDTARAMSRSRTISGLPSMPVTPPGPLSTSCHSA